MNLYSKNSVVPNFEKQQRSDPKIFCLEKYITNAFTGINWNNRPFLLVGYGRTSDTMEICVSMVGEERYTLFLKEIGAEKIEDLKGKKILEFFKRDELRMDSYLGLVPLPSST